MATTIPVAVEDFRKTVEEQYDKCYNEGINSLIGTSYPITDKYVCTISRDESGQHIYLELFFNKREDPSLSYCLYIMPEDKLEVANRTRNIAIKAITDWIIKNEKQGVNNDTN